MHFPPKEVLDDIKKFDKLPDTEESLEIKRKYLSNEIGNLEFFSLAREYLQKVEDKA